MSKPLLIIIAIIVIVFGITGGLFIASRGNDRRVPPTLDGLLRQNTLATPVPTEEEVVYEDSSGISFRYFASMAVTDVTPSNDQSYYTSLNIGNTLKVSALDTAFETVDEWKAGTPGYQAATLSGAASLGGVSAKQYTIDSKLLTVAIDQGILYIVEGDKKSENAYDLLVSSFTFGKAQPKQGSGGTIIYEEEEVVE